MSSAEYIEVPEGIDLSTAHGRNVMDLAIETQRFHKISETDPERAQAFWNRITREFGTRGAGYSDQEFAALSFEADQIVEAMKRRTEG